MAYLVVLKGQNSKQNIALEKDRILMGRNANCDIVLPANDFAVSREHACILRVQGKFFIEDMGSRNGTYVNNQPVTERRPLNDKDRIRICDFLYGFHEATPQPALPSELRPEQTLDEPEGLSSFEASVSTSHQFLQAQPKEKLRILVEISNNLRNTLELDSLLHKAADSLFELFRQADRVFLLIREEGAEPDNALDRLVPKVIKTRRSQDESSASYSRSIVRECLRTVQAFLCDDASTDKRFNMSASIADIRIRSVMCAPLWSQDNQAFGIIQLDTQDRSKKFTQEDLSLLMAVASQASVALENARLHEYQVAAATAAERVRRDLELAQQVQLSFLPRQLPQVPGYDFYAYYEPAQEVGGDYYGFVPLLPEQQRLAILLGDVAGKGVPAALLMAKLSSDARFCLLSQTNLAAAITALNDLLYQHTSRMDRFVTLAAAVLDAAENTLTFVNAGHPAPLIYRRSTGKVEEATTEDTIGLPLGVEEHHSYCSLQVQLQPGDCVLLYSDGVTDQLDKQNNPIQQRAIRTAFQEGNHAPQMLGELIVKLLKQHAAGRAQQDDITLVCYGRTSLTGDGG
ncbi:MAG TPA: SpoIIE family protein phosphatase [Gemmataceae bacterium]|nr:SpoIIE family protein phosphatase [Gemmataceae bacterium]